MKGVILAAGKGARMKGISYNKCLGIVDQKSLIAHNIERLLLMGINEIVIVVGIDSDVIKKHVAEYQQHAEILFAVQTSQMGIVNAIECAVSLLSGSDFVLCLGDEIFHNQKPVEMLEFFTATGADCVCGIVSCASKVEIKKCYSILLDENNNIASLTEKPEKPFNDMKGTGFCIFKNRMLNFIGFVKPNKRSGQYELCDWIKICINNGLICKVYDFAEREFNINTLEDLHQANEFLDSDERRSSK